MRRPLQGGGRGWLNHFFVPHGLRPLVSTKRLGAAGICVVLAAVPPHSRQYRALVSLPWAAAPVQYLSDARSPCGLKAVFRACSSRTSQPGKPPWGFCTGAGSPVWGVEGRRALRWLSPGGARKGGVEKIFAISRCLAIFRNFPAIAPCLSTLRACWCPVCSLLLLEASGGLVTAQQFSRNFPEFPRNFLQLDLTLPDCPPAPPPPLLGQGQGGVPIESTAELGEHPGTRHDGHWRWVPSVSYRSGATERQLGR